MPPEQRERNPGGGGDSPARRRPARGHRCAVRVRVADKRALARGVGGSRRPTGDPGRRPRDRRRAACRRPPGRRARPACWRWCCARSPTRSPARSAGAASVSPAVARPGGGWGCGPPPTRSPTCCVPPATWWPGTRAGVWRWCCARGRPPGRPPVPLGRLGYRRRRPPGGGLGLRAAAHAIADVLRAAGHLGRRLGPASGGGAARGVAHQVARPFRWAASGIAAVARRAGGWGCGPPPTRSPTCWAPRAGSRPRCSAGSAGS